MLVDTFGEMLYYPDSDILKEFPSPEALKKKIIISTKPPKEYLESKSFKGSDSQKRKDQDEEAWGNEVPDIQTEIESAHKVLNCVLYTTFLDNAFKIYSSLNNFLTIYGFMTA